MSSTRTWTDIVLVAIGLATGAKIENAEFEMNGRVVFTITGIRDDWNDLLNTNKLLIPSGELWAALRFARQVIKDIRSAPFAKRNYNGCPYVAAR